jgi:hypothetical protein
MANEASTQEIVVRKSADVAQLDELEAMLLGTKEVPDVVEDPAEIQREIMAQLLDAKSDEELELVGQATGWRELPGVPMQISGFRWRPSTYEEGSPLFFVIDAVRLDTGARVALTTGSGNILAQLTNMARRGTLVGSVRALEIADTPTKQGFKPNWLRTPSQAMIEDAKAASERVKAGAERAQAPAQEAKA